MMSCRIIVLGEAVFSI